MRRPLSIGLAVALAVTFLATGCRTTGGLSLDEVSEDPIAFVYWDGPTARKRREQLEQIEGAQAGLGRVGVASLDSVAALVGSGNASALQLRQFPGRIVLLNPRTLEITPFTAAPPNARPLAWSAGQERLLFNSAHHGGKTQLFEYVSETGEVRKVTHGPTYHLEGDYGPDGRMLVTWVRITPDRQVAGLDLRPRGGGNPEALVDGIYPSTPRWSPKGDAMIYVEAGNEDARRDRSVIVAQTVSPGAQRDPLARGREAVFTPDGESIVFAAQSAKGWRLNRMRADGSGRAPLGVSPRDERWPAVSPDGRHVVYISNDGLHDRLYIRRIDGTGDRILLEDGEAAFPVW